MSEYVKNKMTYAVICLTVLGLIVWIIAGISSRTEQSGIMVDQQTYTMETQESVAAEDSTSETLLQQGYYMIRAVDRKVNVYWVDQSGEHLHKETTIPFELLSTEDQKLLENGVRFDNDEDLAGFLESYDS